MSGSTGSMPGGRRGRLVLVVPAFPQLSETFIANKAIGLLDRGWDVHVVCATSAPSNWSAFGADHPVHRLRNRVHTMLPRRPAEAIPAVVRSIGGLATERSRELRTYVEVARRKHLPIVRGVYVDEALVRLQPDIIHFEFGPGAVGRLPLRDLIDSAVTVSFRGSDLNVIALDDDDHYVEVWEHADGIHVLGESLLRKARERGATATTPITIIRPAIDPEPIAVRRQPAPTIDPGRPLRIVSVGRLHWTKAPLDALEAASILRRGGVPVEHRFIGGGDLLSALAFWRHELGLDDAVELVGAATPDQVAEHLAWADVMLHSAITEGFCNAVLEGQAHALPVMCTDAGGLPENVDDGVTGIVVPRRDPQRLADALAELARDPELRERMGAAGRRRVERSFRLTDQLDAWERFYEAALDRRSPRSDAGPSATRVESRECRPREHVGARSTGAGSAVIDPVRCWAGDLRGIDIANRSVRLSLHPVVRALLDDRLDPETRAERYGSLLTHYELTELDEAEIAVLPFSYGTTEAAEVHRRLTQAEHRGLRTLVWGAGDIEPLLPSESMVLLHAGPTRGAQPRATALAIPIFFADRWPGGSRPDLDRPSIAFCGQGTAGSASAAVQAGRRGMAWAMNRLAPRTVPPPVRGHVGLRADALRLLSEDPRVNDHFVIRDRYRAGVSTTADRDRTQGEFDRNLETSAYALCVRGTGTFSARFSEARSCGRVPLFVDTACVLPFEDEIDWRARCAWVDATDVGVIADRLVDEHARADLAELRRSESLRKLWEDRLTQDGYFRNLAATLRGLI